MSVTAASLPYPVAAAPVRSAQDRLFVHGTLFSTLFLQKFGFSFGHSFLLLALPVCLVIWGWIIFSGKARINDRALFLYGLLICSVLLDAVVVSLNPAKLDNFSVSSLALLIVLYGFFVFEPSDKFDTSIVVDLYLKYTLAFAVLGIFQYAAQFAGLRISSLSASLPVLRPFLLEEFFNSNAIVAYGSNVIRSNAIFLGEPSALSQLLAMAIAVEISVKRRFRYLPVYILAYLTTFSGTGLLSLIVAVIFSALFSFKDALRVPAIILCGVVLGGLVSVAAPDIADRYLNRLGEFGSTQSSAYARYVAQGHAWTQMIDDGSILSGNGPGSFDRTFGSQGIASNPILKLSNDYGIGSMLVCLALIATTIWLPQARIISLSFLAALLLGGGNELNPCFLAPMLVLCVWGLKHRSLATAPPEAGAFATARQVGA